MSIANHDLSSINTLVERAAGAATGAATRPAIFKVVGIVLAITSGLFIGVSFVVKKMGLLAANKKYKQEAGEGYGYLKNWIWWVGMTLMILGEACNFGAYLFVDAIVVTCLGALSVVTTTILSTIFLKERLSFVGKLGCLNCIIGSVIIVLNAPTQSAVANIKEMQDYVIHPGFLTYMGIVVVGSLFTAFWVGPRYGKKSMLVYISICSWTGGLSVVGIQGFGAALVTQIGGTPQFNSWFIYVLLVFVICTLVTEILFLNKALNLFNAALVTPTYYVYFTTATIISSSVLFRGFKGSALSIVTVVMGFLQICTGVVLLQLAKSSKDVPDTAVFKGDLDQVRTIAEQPEPESEPRADTIRGGGVLLRALSQRRARREEEEAKTLRTETMEPIGEDEVVEWDGLRRRKTVLGKTPQPGSLKRSKTLHPPLGMSKFPDDETNSDAESDEVHPGFFPRIGSSLRKSRGRQRSSGSPVPMTSIHVPDKERPAGYTDRSVSREHVYGLPAALKPQLDGSADTAYHSPSQHIQWDSSARDSRHGSPAPRPPPHGRVPNDKVVPARRTFSFQNVFSRQRSDASRALDSDDGNSRSSSRNGSRAGALSAMSFTVSTRPGNSPLSKINTEEERLGLVKGDSTSNVPLHREPPTLTTPERPLMQTRHTQQGVNHLTAVRDSPGSDTWHATERPTASRTTTAAGSGRDRSGTNASAESTNENTVVISPFIGHADAALAAHSQEPAGRQAPRRGYQRGRYADSDDDDDLDDGMGTVQTHSLGRR